MSKNKNYLVQGSVLAIAGLITRFIGMLYRIPLTNAVGSEGMGYYSTAYEIYNIALLISSYSIPVAISKIISAKEAKGEYAAAQKVFRVGILFSSCVGLCASLVLIIFADELASFMGYPSAAIPLRILAPTIFVFSIMGVIRGFFQGRHNMVPTAVSQIVEQIFNAIFSVVCAILFMKAASDTTVAAWGAAGGTAGTLAGAISGLVFLVIVFLMKRRSVKEKASDSVLTKDDTAGKVLKLVFFTMLPIILSQTIYQLSGIIDNFMFGRIMESKGFDEAARSMLFESYSNRYKWLYNVPVAVASAFGVSIVPTLSAGYAEGNIDGIREKIHSSVKLNMIIAIPSAAGLSFLGGPILGMLFSGSESTLSHELMTYGGIAVVVFALSTLTNGVLQGINRLSLPVRHAAISLAIHVILLFALLEFTDLGAYALVIGNVTYGLVVCILNARSIRKAIDYKQEIKTSFVIPAIAAVIMGAAGRGLYELLMKLIGMNLIACIVSLCFCVVVYFILLLLLGGLSKDEILNLPKGRLLYRIFSKLHLVR